MIFLHVQVVALQIVVAQKKLEFEPLEYSANITQMPVIEISIQ